MAKLTTKARADIPGKEFAGPDRSYPVENKAHAKDAKARASEEEHKGKLSKGEEEHIDEKADKVLGRRPKNPHGNPGHHPSTKGFDHEGYKHTSSHR
jgi:hypothetical protein